MQKKQILLIDDEPDVTGLLKLNLENTGAYEVREENRAEHALATARTFKPDLIILDIMMPNVDGGEVAAQLKADKALKETPLVFLTAVATKKEAKEMGGTIGGHPFIAKPANLEELEELIEKQLRKNKEECAVAKKKILLIDDEEDACTVLKLVIETTTQYEALVATSGEAGLELIKTHKPDLVLLDIMMPGMDGIATLKRIKDTAPDLPVAMVTAVHREEEARKCFDLGAYEYITKPVDFEQLKTALLVKLF